MRTPGPWRINKQSNNIKGSNGAFVANLNGVVMGDANLMAAAPELLEALQRVRELLAVAPSVGGRVGLRGRTEAALEIIDNAVRKTTGDKP